MAFTDRSGNYADTEFLVDPVGPDHLIHGYLGSAWATFICYGAMMVLSYLLGQRYFPVKYNLGRFFGYLGLAIMLYMASIYIQPEGLFTRVVFHTMLLVIFATAAYLFEKPKRVISR